MRKKGAAMWTKAKKGSVSWPWAGVGEGLDFSQARPGLDGAPRAGSWGLIPAELTLAADTSFRFEPGGWE